MTEPPRMDQPLHTGIIGRGQVYKPKPAKSIAELLNETAPSELAAASPKMSWETQRREMGSRLLIRFLRRRLWPKTRSAIRVWIGGLVLDLRERRRQDVERSLMSPRSMSPSALQHEVRELRLQVEVYQRDICAISAAAMAARSALEENLANNTGLEARMKELELKVVEGTDAKLQRVFCHPPAGLAILKSVIQQWKSFRIFQALMIWRVRSSGKHSVESLYRHELLAEVDDLKKEFQEVRARVEGTIADINQGVAQTEYEASQAHQLLSNSFDVLRRKSHDSEQLAQSLAHANQLLAVAQTSLRAKPLRRLSSPDTLPKSRKLNF